MCVVRAGSARVACRVRTDRDWRTCPRGRMMQRQGGAEGALRGGMARLAGGGVLAAVLIAVAAGAGTLLRAALSETVTLVPVPGAASIAALHGEGANMPEAYLVAHIRVHDNQKDGSRNSGSWADRRSPSMAGAFLSVIRLPSIAKGTCVAQSL